MRQLLLGMLLTFAVSVCAAQEKNMQKPDIKNLEDYFQFNDVRQLSIFFGIENVFTENVFYQKPEDGGKPYLVSQVNFGTPKAILVIWSGDGKVLCGVQASAFYYDYKIKKMNLIPNNWKTKQGIHAGLKLTNLVKVNWFPLSIKTNGAKANYGIVLPGFGRLKDQIKVPPANQKLIYEYTLDLKNVNEQFAKSPKAILRSNNKIVKKLNPMLEMISIYRDGFKPEN